MPGVFIWRFMFKKSKEAEAEVSEVKPVNSTVDVNELPQALPLGVESVRYLKQMDGDKCERVVVYRKDGKSVMSEEDFNKSYSPVGA